MRKILLVGAGPLANVDPDHASGPSIRSTQFFLPLREEGHDVVFAALGGPEVRAAREPVPVPGGGAMVELSPAAMLAGKTLRALAERFRPDAVIGCGSILPDAAAAGLSDLAPTWVDLFGDPICELQSKAAVYPDQDLSTDLHHVWRLFQRCVRRADRLSTVSNAQAHAMVGCLGLMGRLTGATAAVPMVHCIPCGILPPTAPPASPRPRRFRGIHCPEDAFLAAWSGSYNTWIDPDLLFEGLRGAMERVPRLRFVSTGGGSPGYNERVYEQFRRRALASPSADRFHFLGWIPRIEAETAHRECDVGLNIDRWCYEAVLGSRNRILNFLDLGVPVATTIVTELTRDLLAAGGVIPLPLGDAEAMASTLAALAADPAPPRQGLARGQAFVRSHYTFRQTVEPLLEWAASPQRAGDFRPQGVAANPVAQLTDFESIEAEIARRHSTPPAPASLPRQCLDRLRGWLRP